MNILTTAWYWKKFYWKVFSTAFITGSGAFIAALGDEADIMSPKVLAWTLITLGTSQAIIKSVDALIDQTFQNLISGSGSSGNSGGTSFFTKTQQTAAPGQIQPYPTK